MPEEKRMEYTVEEHLDVLVETTLGIATPEFIRLFGSRAYGVPREDSDVDVCIVFDEKKLVAELSLDTGDVLAKKSLRDMSGTFLLRALGVKIKERCYEKLPRNRLDIDILVMSIDGVRKDYGLGFAIDDILEKGLLLWGNSYEE